MGKYLRATVEGQDGVHTVSSAVKGSSVEAACRCDIGAEGGCPHGHAFARPFLQPGERLHEVKPQPVKQVRTLANLRASLQGIMLTILLTTLKAQGISHKACAEGIGMHPRHLAARNAREWRHHDDHERGATKLAGLWVLEHRRKEAYPCDRPRGYGRISQKRRRAK
jgi:hypothetical protein